MKIAIFVAAVSVSFAVLSVAAEHPEHPTAKPAAPAQEHPAAKPDKEKKAEHPAHEHPVGSKHWLKDVRKGYTAAVEKKVKDDIAAGGFTVKDEKLGKDWNLKLDHVHKDRIVSLGGDKFFACADFKSAEKGSKEKVDLDFYATKKGDSWSIDKVLVHKVDGKERYTYNDKNEMVPVDK